MPRQHKIKRSMEIRGKGTYKARPHPLFVLFVVAALGGLVYLGTIIYQPVHNAIMNWEAGRGTVQQPQLPGVGAAEQPDPAESFAPTPPATDNATDGEGRRSARDLRAPCPVGGWGGF